MDAICSCAGGAVVVPEHPFIDRADGGHLVVNPAREVWDRSDLSCDELMQWAALAAAAGWAMLNALPQLADGCINYWDAGNWALHEDAVPAGPKRPGAHRKVHLHLLGRSRTASHPSWRWGEAPLWPRFADRVRWAESFDPLTAKERSAIAKLIAGRLESAYWPATSGNKR